ncbi:hypothetical protein PHYSODRAFT_288855 [Phytophthora sojae]|uniref:RxLR effector protein n=2 Tax=Phytophthora sojae TaxID=67593 RepID=G5A9E2_PHYSP|nr:hypothetical protein PHYSODRAFT_288855 [Phytophthora sojae]AEK80924.1 Avh209 [Phytophthora sojae]AEK80925.1 Avh209 [Phytophthora sojae]AEK80926.1 Avh209 [Phytophthora sojae]EGZ08517.1 hypothetical protein PHYSODRAFT_288855 [Phytophthora sojae]|eukprot:XP_009536689.1 hypothetical protein PHYSODRAFT_288855 [Phytophthora sojae]
MPLPRLLLLLLAPCIATSNAVAAAEDRSPSLESKTRHNDPGNRRAASGDEGRTRNFGNEEGEERELAFLSKLKGVSRMKKSGLPTNVASLRKNPGVVEALAKNPSVGLRL